MRPKKQSESYLDVFNSSNWNFELQEDDPKIGCPDGQLFDCYEYEYSRQMVLSGKTSEKSVVDEDDKRLKSFYNLFEDAFPKTPWLDIPEATRSERLQVLAEVWTTVPSFEAVPIARLQMNGEYKDELEWVQIEYENNQVTVLPIQIGWHHSDDEILDSFKAWIKKFRPTYMVPSSEGRGKDERSSIKRALKELGAYRLLGSMEAKKATSFTLGKCGIKLGPLYMSKKGWSDAKAGAIKILDSWLQPSALLHDKKDDMPTDIKFSKPPLLSRLRRWVACGPSNRVPFRSALINRDKQYFSRALWIPAAANMITPFSLTQGVDGLSDEIRSSIAGKECRIVTVQKSPYTEEELKINRKHMGKGAEPVKEKKKISTL